MTIQFCENEKKKTKRNHKTNVILKEKATFNEQECK